MQAVTPLRMRGLAPTFCTTSSKTLPLSHLSLLAFETDIFSSSRAADSSLELPAWNAFELLMHIELLLFFLSIASQQPLNNFGDMLFDVF